MPTIAESILDAARLLACQCNELQFSAKVHTVYNAFDYAMPGYAAYVLRCGNTSKRAIFLGMNPGPWGMAQTGVPFGEIAAVRDWIGIEASIPKPLVEHPKRPVEGFDCRRSEVSGRRLWGLFAEIFGSPEAFFEKFFVFNYCPLAFMTATGANLTPDKLNAEERQRVESVCDAHLKKVIAILSPEIAVGVGGFATKCLQRLDVRGLRIGTILHPSPASPTANREWPGKPVSQLRELGLLD